MRENIAYIFLLGCFNLLIYLLFNDCRHLSVSRSKATHTYGLDCDESAIPMESGLFVADDIVAVFQVFQVFQVFCGLELTGWR